MDKKRKKIIIGFSLFLAAIQIIIFPVALFYSMKGNPNELLLKIPTGFEVSGVDYNSKAEKTKSIINNIKNLVFGNNKNEELIFVESQKKEKELLKEAKTLSEKYLHSKSTEDYSNLINFFNKNWLFALSNIEKFNLNFHKYWYFEQDAKSDAEHTADFLNKVRNKTPNETNFSIKSKYFNHFQIGEESKHSDNNFLYIRQSKIIFRIVVSKLKESKQNYELKFDKIIFFPDSNTERISVQTISDTIHVALYHHNEEGYKKFERDIVGEYGLAWDSILTFKGEKENEK
ncbi:aromatic motif membrane protein [Mycoplasma leachii]|uniref:aromatic motif membrane protein n=1 Tax=Mycoplasma leachii TaxID=2105 RepID=UPI003DA54DB7